jgi:peptidyl-prolyl cis-trans isomerase C
LFHIFRFDFYFSIKEVAMKLTRLSLALASASLLAAANFAVAQTQPPRPSAPPQPRPAAPVAAPQAAAPATNNAVPIDNALIDFLVKEQVAQGQGQVQDGPQLREAVRAELQTREVLSRAARAKNIQSQAEVKAQMDLAAQSALIRAYLADYSKTAGPSEQTLQGEYNRIKSQLGDKEYRARHILVEKKTEAEEIIKALQGGEAFEKLASRSKDEGSKVNGGDLDWAAPGNFVKPFADAMTGLQKGKFTATPIETQFGWHVIKLEDERAAKIPPYEEVKPQLAQRLQNEVVQKHIGELREKAGLK